MIGRAEIERSLKGAWRLFLDKPDAIRSFDTSMEGFWRSFQVIVLLVPVYFVMALSDRNGVYSDAIASGTFSNEAFWTAQVLTWVLDWVALPTLLAGLAGLIGIKREYPAYIVVRNWSAVIMAVPFTAVSLLEDFGSNEELVLIASLAALAFSFRFGYLIARRTLNVGMDVAIGLVALDILVSFAVVKLIGRFSGIELLD